jgi:NAD(P)-dependent dehydrogenase (short-subunit alcohol dehydrogenase family)
MREMVEDTVVVVTGSTRGIGKATALHLAAQGARVAVVGRSSARGEGVVADILKTGGQAQHFTCDVSHEQDVRTLFDKVGTAWGRVDAVVNNASPTDLVERERRVTEQTTENFDHCIRGGLDSGVGALKSGRPALGDAGGGFVTISSLAAVSSRPAEPSYAASKAAAAALTRQVAVDYGQQGIRANILMLGFVRTNASAPLLENARIGSAVAAATPGGVVTSDDCARAVAFLISPDSVGFNGSTFTLDGGMSAVSHIPDLSV